MRLIVPNISRVAELIIGRDDEDDFSYPFDTHYDYVYDPDHRKRLGPEYFKTPQGWSTNPQHKEKVEGFEDLSREIKSIVEESKKSGTWLKAQNGKDSKLTEREWVTVRTKNFKSWFGDWQNDPKNSSKVIDENGEPLVCTHSSDSLIRRFDQSYIGASDQGWFGYGFYFHDHKVEDNGSYFYGTYANNCFLNIRNPFSFEPEQVKSFFNKGFRFDGCEDYKITKVEDPVASFNKIHDELIGDDQEKRKVFSTLIKQYSDFLNIRKSGFKDIPEEYSSMFGKGVDDVESFWFYEFDDSVDKTCEKESKIGNKEIDYYHIGAFAKLTARMYEGVEIPSDLVRTFSEIKYGKAYDYEEMASADAIFDRGNNSYEVTQDLIRAGFDGVDARCYEESFCVFSPNNIKSADHNSGGFDPSSPYSDK